MRKVLLVAGREFWQRLRTRGFILSAVLTPVILLVVWASGNLGGPNAGEAGVDLPRDETESVVAYVDQADVIERPAPGFPASRFHEFVTEEAAAAALADGEIDAYFVVEPDYRETGDVRRVSTELPARPPDTALFDWLLQSNLLPGAKPEMFGRLQNPFQSASLPVTTVHPTQETTGAQDTLNMAPFLVALLVMIPLFTSGSYLLTSLTEEKGNRIMEILLVSLRPPALLAGKLLGLGALTMVQYLIWIVLGAAAFLVVGADFSALTSAVNLAPSELVLVLLYALGGYALYATLMAGLGALSPNMEGARTWVFVITLPMLIPIYLWVVVVNNPGSALALALSLIPFSAPIAMLMRLASATVPTWQVVLSLALLAATAVGMIWLMSRLFRTQTLLSGEPFSVGRFWSVLREG